ncbi:MAG: sugar phosphate isomerase/epimerase [Lentisphaeria bacterium]|nr:sugar phosphate isomerase/epimerase [Lentisphaeria bacterium]
MLKDKLSHFYGDWNKVADNGIAGGMAHFVAACQPRMVVHSGWCDRILEDPGFVKVLKRAYEQSGAIPQGSHAPFWNVPEVSVDSFTDDPNSRFVKKHLYFLEMLPAEFGVRTYTIHIGCLPEGLTVEQYRKVVIRGLELLVPIAEKNHMTIAVENGFGTISDADALQSYVGYFKGSPAIGVCLDVGHANINYRAPGKTRGDIRLRPVNLGGAPFVFSEKHWEEVLSPHIVVAHLHDNDGLGDEHKMPMTGTVDWPLILGILAKAPRLQSIEDEASPRGMSPEEVCGVYDRLLCGR